MSQQLSAPEIKREAPRVSTAVSVLTRCRVRVHSDHHPTRRTACPRATSLTYTLLQPQMRMTGAPHSKAKALQATLTTHPCNLLYIVKDPAFLVCAHADARHIRTKLGGLLLLQRKHGLKATLSVVATPGHAST